MPDEALLEDVCETYAAQRALTGSVVRRPLATWVRNLDAPIHWDANHASRIVAETPSEIDAVFATWDDLYGDRNQHRMFLCDPRTPTPFVARLALEGFRVDPTLQMVLEGPLERNRPDDVAIRLAESDSDWRRVAQLIRAEHVDEARREERASHDTSLSQLMADARRAMQPGVRTWLARVDGDDCGHFSSWIAPTGMGMLEWLFTLPTLRRRGVATALLDHCVADVRARGAERVLIGASTAGYDAPRRFYAAAGFRPLCLTWSFSELRTARSS